ncbi:peptidase [Gymnodinialimonas sp. 57CJ19]|uniref:peptidase n=1 Tax=Gymnodinialimonas sp. 57CJ19 TaxID=3138498 RepID=UPI00313448E4
MNDVVRTARAWVGTPYVHQAACKGAGCDCLGLLLGVWRELYGDLPAPVPAYTNDWSETSHEERLLHAARKHLIEKPLKECAAGDVLIFRMRKGAVAKHVGLQTQAHPQPRFLHAYSGRGVTEGAFTPPWARRVAARFAFPERNN